jgi:hypothetical protein
MALERPHDNYEIYITKMGRAKSVPNVFYFVEVSARIFRIKNAHIKLRQGSKNINIRSGNEDMFILL